jgi:hypothetical protein
VTGGQPASAWGRRSDVRLRVLAAFVLAFAALMGVSTADSDERQIIGTPLNGPPGTVVTVTEVPDECPGELIVLIAPLEDVGDNPPGDLFIPPRGTFTIPDIPEGVYQILFACPGHGLGGFRFGVTPAAIAADARFAG